MAFLERTSNGLDGSALCSFHEEGGGGGGGGGGEITSSSIPFLHRNRTT